MSSRPARLVSKRATAEEKAVLDRANAQARAMLKAADRKSTVDELWEELDRVVGELLADWSAPPTSREEALALGELRGQAQGLAYSIAAMTQPLGDRSVDDIRSEAMERHESASRPRRKRTTTKIAKPSRTKIV